MSAALILSPAQAARLIADLMPIAIAVAGPGADAVATVLRAAGAEAQATPTGETDGQDLAVLLAAGAAPAVMACAARLMERVDRILVLPAGEGDLSALLELCVDAGFQPVLDYEAGFLDRGAFLLDRNAVADEEGLAAFAARHEAPPAPAAPTAADTRDQTIAALQRDLALARAALAEAEAARDAAVAEIRAWAPLRHWVEARVRGERARPPGLFATRRARRAAADAAAIRAAAAFEPAWYIASHPDLAAGGADPVAHYLAHAGHSDPGPWFDTAAYLAAHPDCDSAREAPLLHALRQGNVPGEHASGLKTPPE